MTKYRVNYTTCASYGVEVEADDEDEAIDKAERVGAPSLCAHCSMSSYGSSPGIDLGEWEPDEQYPVEVIEESARSGSPEDQTTRGEK